MRNCLRINHRYLYTVLPGLLLLTSFADSYAQPSISSAYQSLSSALQDEPLTQIILRHTGHVVIVSENSAPRGIAGRWDRKLRTIFIYLNQVSTYEDYKEVLRHEAIHMAQFCNGLKQGHSTPIPIGAIISDTAQSVYSIGRKEGIYNDSQEILEAEAYTMEKSDDQEVISLIALQCNDLRSQAK